MAHFRATIKGNRGEASRLGSSASGISAAVNGWNQGIAVTAYAQNDTDCFHISATGGSSGANLRYIATLRGDCLTLHNTGKSFSISTGKPWKEPRARK